MQIKRMTAMRQSLIGRHFVRTLATLTEYTATGFKMRKDRVTVMFHDNASGKHEFPLLVIWKSTKSRPFTNYQFKHFIFEILPTDSAWMKQDIFQDRLHKIFVHMWYRKCLPQEAILLIDNVAAYPVQDWKDGDDKISCHFLPSKTSSVSEPMDGRVIESMKGTYHDTFTQKRGVCGGAVGWGTALQAGSSRVRFPMVSLKFFIDINLPAAIWPRGWLSL